MGMDLIPVNDLEPFHANWTGWRCLAELLTDAGADLSAMAGSNDGDPVDATTAIAWADAIDAALEADTIVLVSVADDIYVDGRRDHVRTEAGQVARPVIARVLNDAVSRNRAEYAHIHADSYPAVVAELAELPPCDVEIGPLDDNTRGFLVAFTWFLRISGGFTQW